MPAFLTSDFTLIDPADFTKQLKFDTSAVATGKVRTIIVPAAAWFVTNNSLTLASIEGGNYFRASQIIQLPTDGDPFRIDQADDASQARPLFWCKSPGSTALLVINYRGNLQDNEFGVCEGEGAAGPGDPTKRFFFDASGISTATDRIFTAPDASGTIALDTSVLVYDGDVVTYDDDLVSI